MRPHSNQKQEGSFLIKNLKPVLNEGEYVFCMVQDLGPYKDLPLVGSFREEEGITLILDKQSADRAGLPYYYIGAWITLQVNSSLASIGLTAAVSEVLARNRISCNMVAGYHHDHVFVDHTKADLALQLLRQLSRYI
jgi:hypothetical protein